MVRCCVDAIASTASCKSICGSARTNSTNVLDGGLGSDEDIRESADWLTAPDDLDPVALRCALWKLTQIKFDEALEDYYDHRKAMVAEYLRDEVASFTRETPCRVLEPIESFDQTEALPLDRWASELVQLSRRLLDHPDIHDPSVSIRGERVHRWFVDSDGSMVRSADLWLEFEVRGWVLTDDGVYVESSRSWPARSVAEMLDAQTMATLFDEVVAELEQLREAESPGSFIGPALLLGQAASTMFQRGARAPARGQPLGRARRDADLRQHVGRARARAGAARVRRPHAHARGRSLAVGQLSRRRRRRASGPRRGWCAMDCWSGFCAIERHCLYRGRAGGRAKPSARPSPSARTGTAARPGSSAAWRGWAT